LKKLLEAAVYTGTGEFIELLAGTEKIDDIQPLKKLFDVAA